MRILLVTTELLTSDSPSGGLANSLSRLAIALESFGHDVRVLGPGNELKNTLFPNFSTYPDDPGPIWHSIDILTLRRFNVGVTAIARARWAARSIRRLITVFNPNIVLYPNLGGIGLFRPTQIPAIIRISSDTRSCRNCGGYDNQSAFAMLQKIALENAALRRADALYAPSSRTARSVAQTLHRPVDVLRTPFFLETLREDDSVLRERLSGRAYMIFVGLLNRLKGVPVIAEILPRLMMRHTDLNFVFVGREHAGFKGNSMQDHVLKLAGDARNRIHFLGELSHRRLYPLIRGAEGVVLPSLVDNLPNTCLESMALAKVVIGTQGTSFEELIDDGVSGVLCRPGNPDSLEDAIEKVLALSGAQIRIMGQRAHETARQFEPQQTIPPLVDFFERVVQNHGCATLQGRN